MDDDVIMSDDDFRRTVLINAPDPEDLEVRMARIKSWKRDRSARARGATKSTSLRELAEQHTKPAVDGTVKLIMERQSEEIRTHGVAHLTRAPAKFERTRDAANRVKQWKTPEDAFAAEQKRHQPVDSRGRCQAAATTIAGERGAAAPLRICPTFPMKI